jgi:hypothetical protein
LAIALPGATAIRAPSMAAAKHRETAIIAQTDRYLNEFLLTIYASLSRTPAMLKS